MGTGTSWQCKECGTVLGWLDASGLNVNREAVARYTLPALSEEIWVTCGHCGAVQIWRARVELPERYDEFNTDREVV